ncbi:MOS1T transposase, partial [Pseudoatta argentina]
MSIFVPNKVYLRGILLHYFIEKKSAAEAHRILGYDMLQVDESTVSRRLKGLGMVQKQGHWVPYELKPRTTASTAEKKRFFASHRIVTGDEKWIPYDNPKRRKSWGKPGHASTSSAKPNNAQASCCKTSKNLPGNA